MISIVMFKFTFPRIMKFILVLLITIYCLNNQAISQAVVKECDTPTWAASMGDEGCISECGDLDVTAEVNGFRSLCSGRATSFKIKFYKIGFREQSSSTICWVWTGEVDLDLGNLSAGSTAATERMNSDCPAATYDAIVFVMNRITQVAGYGTFPDGSGKIARTGPNHTGAQLNVDSSTTSLWLETSISYSDTDLNYMRPSNSWNLPYKKAGTTPSSADQTADSDSLHGIDEFKGEILAGVLQSDGVTYCDDNACTKVDQSDSTKVYFTNTVDPGWVTGLPFIYDGGNIPSVEFSYVGRQSTGFRGGLDMIWYNNNGTAQFLGFQAKWDGVKISIK